MASLLFLPFLKLTLLSVRLVSRYHLRDTNISGQTPTTIAKSYRDYKPLKYKQSQQLGTWKGILKPCHLSGQGYECVEVGGTCMLPSLVSGCSNYSRVFSVQACTSVADYIQLLHKLGDFPPNGGQHISCTAPFSLWVHSFLVLNFTALLNNFCRVCLIGTSQQKQKKPIKCLYSSLCGFFCLTINLHF